MRFHTCYQIEATRERCMRDDRLHVTHSVRKQTLKKRYRMSPQRPTPHHPRPLPSPTACTHHVSFERVQAAKAQALGFALEIVGVAQEQ